MIKENKFHSLNYQIINSTNYNSINKKVMQIEIVRLFGIKPILNRILKYTASFDCNNCNKKLTKPQCNACHRMVDYFKIFDIPQNYKVDVLEISQKAKSLQKQFHPDKNINSEDKYHEKYSSYINSAKSILSDDLKRAEYLLSLRGIQPYNDQSIIQDSAFMKDMFELQEQIENAHSDSQIKNIKKRIQTILEYVKEGINNMFEKQDSKKCLQFLHKYRYLFCALENINKKVTTNSLQ